MIPHSNARQASSVVASQSQSTKVTLSQTLAKINQPGPGLDEPSMGKLSEKNHCGRNVCIPTIAYQ